MVKVVMGIMIMRQVDDDSDGVVIVIMVWRR